MNGRSRREEKKEDSPLCDCFQLTFLIEICFYSNGHFSYGWNNSCKLFRTQVVGLEITNVQFVAYKWLQAKVTCCKILYKLLLLYTSLVLHSSVLSNVYGFN